MKASQTLIALICVKIAQQDRLLSVNQLMVYFCIHFA